MQAPPPYFDAGFAAAPAHDLAPFFGGGPALRGLALRGGHELLPEAALGHQAAGGLPEMRFVGGGRGGYALEGGEHIGYCYVFVGAGGDYEPLQEPPPPSDTPRLARRRLLGCLGAGVCLAVFIATSALVSLASSFGSATTTLSVPEELRPLYDCTASFATWDKAWDEDKRSWCCYNLQRGCRTESTTEIGRRPVIVAGEDKAYDCKAGLATWESGWSLVKKAFCCQFEQKGCPTASAQYNGVFDCNSGFADWATGWSYEKKAWCCSRAQKGCPGTEPHQGGAGVGVFECDGWQGAWSPEQRAGCCAKDGRGCPTAAPSATPPPFDCLLGYDTWEAGWTSQKKEYCCREAGRGCGDAQPPLGTPEQRYNCYQLSDLMALWPAEHKAWCCQQFKRGCPGSALADALPIPIAVASASGRGYDCETLAAKGTAAWPPEQQRWCCAHQGRGCQHGSDTTHAAATWPVTTRQAPLRASAPAVTTRAHFDCDVAAEVLWGKDKQDFCCKSAGRGCPEAFDCAVGLKGWEFGWSAAKKRWCCDHHGHGCPATTTAMSFTCDEGDGVGQSGWSNEKRDWCCRQRNKGCSTFGGPAVKQFDCDAGISDWDLGWSVYKKAWCCKNEEKGCG